MNKAKKLTTETIESSGSTRIAYPVDMAEINDLLRKISSRKSPHSPQERMRLAYEILDSCLDMAHLRTRLGKLDSVLAAMESLSRACTAIKSIREVDGVQTSSILADAEKIRNIEMIFPELSEIAASALGAQKIES